MTSGNDILMSGGVPAAKFKDLNKWVSGTVSGEPEARQASDPDGTPKTFPDGKPMMEVLIDIETDERDPSITGDDGLRRLYVGGKMLAAVRQAVRNAGAPGVKPGGQLAVRWVGEEPPKVRGHNPAKLYEAMYKPPAQNILSTSADEEIEPDDLPF